MITPRLEVESLSVAYRGAPVVHEVSFSVSAGRTLALIGESGSGKSTIARSILRLPGTRRPSVQGSIRVDGTELTTRSDSRFQPLRGRVLGFVPQDPGSALNPVRSIGAQAREAAALVPGARTRDEQDALLRASLDRVGLADVERILAAFPHQLSGGQLQRVLIALAILPGPRLLIADEPTSALDVTVQRQILDLLDTLRTELDLAILLITHDLAIAAERADEVVVLRDGEIQEAGPAGQVLSAPRSDYTRSLAADAPGLNPDRLAPARARRDALRPLEEAEEHVVIDRVSRTFRLRAQEVAALSEVSFSVHRGRTHALVGESGSGKSTLARALMGLETTDSGTLSIDGVLIDPGDRRAVRGLRRQVQMVHQNPYTSLDPRFTVERIVREPLERYRLGDRHWRNERLGWALDAVQLPADLRGRRPGSLSGGQRQRVAIARALSLRPEVLVLDEPTSALDVSVQAGILDVLAELQAEVGLTYLLITHDLAVVRQIADTVTVLRRGLVVESGTADEVLGDPADRYTRSLLEAVPSRRDVPLEVLA